MNLNDESTEANTQVAAQVNPPSDTATMDESTGNGDRRRLNTKKLCLRWGQVESLKAQLEERSNQYMRIAADFENFRKRTQRKKTQSSK